jgi:PAS domain S-box-containing protein
MVDLLNSAPHLSGSRNAGDEQFREIAEAAPAIMWVTDPTGFCTYLNKQWYEFTGQQQAEALGYGWTDAVHPDDREPSARTFLEALERREPFQLDYRLRRRDGNYRYAVDAGTPRFDSTGAFLGYVGCVFDITERRELERALLQAQKMEAVGRLAGGIAHDFNNLLTTISGHAHLVAEDLGDEHPARVDLQEIALAVQRASALTKRLLAFSKQQVLRPEIVDLNAAVRDAENMFSRIIGEDIELRVGLSEGLPAVRADRSQIEQVILNLVVNAREAMPGGGILEITTNAPDAPRGMPFDEARFVTLTVRDTGCGMDEATKQHLFEPFFTTKPGGTGLGLATVYGIVRQTDGEIRVDSKVGQGTAFTLRFPASGECVTLPQATAPASENGCEKILLVEDESAVLAIATRVLRQRGYEVVSASTAAEAMAKLALHDDVRLVLTDVVMPGGTGLELARHVTRLGRSISVLLMSGYAGDEILRRGLSSQEYAFLKKPFSPAELARAVRDALAT